MEAYVGVLLRNSQISAQRNIEDKGSAVRGNVPVLGIPMFGGRRFWMPLSLLSLKNADQWHNIPYGQ